MSEIHYALRGGSFCDIQRNARPAGRLRDYPHERSGNGGFRVVTNGFKTTHRVLRGGSFNHSRENVRPVHRYRNFPAGRSGYVGFRMVVNGVRGK